MPTLATLMLDAMTHLLHRRGHPTDVARRLAAELLRRPAPPVWAERPAPDAARQAP
ncbi:hypothetical protein [Deinococcus sp. PEB2-63]